MMFQMVSIIYQPAFLFSLKRGLVHMILIKCMQLKGTSYSEMITFPALTVHIMEQLFIPDFQC